MKSPLSQVPSIQAALKCRSGRWFGSKSWRYLRLFRRVEEAGQSDQLLVQLFDLGPINATAFLPFISLEDALKEVPARMREEREAESEKISQIRDQDRDSFRNEENETSNRILGIPDRVDLFVENDQNHNANHKHNYEDDNEDNASRESCPIRFAGQPS